MVQERTTSIKYPGSSEGVSDRRQIRRQVGSSGPDPCPWIRA